MADMLTVAAAAKAAAVWQPQFVADLRLVSSVLMLVRSSGPLAFAAGAEIPQKVNYISPPRCRVIHAAPLHMLPAHFARPALLLWMQLLYGLTTRYWPAPQRVCGRCSRV